MACFSDVEPSRCRSRSRARVSSSGCCVCGAGPDSRPSSVAIRGRNGEPAPVQGCEPPEHGAGLRLRGCASDGRSWPGRRRAVVPPLVQGEWRGARQSQPSAVPMYGDVRQRFRSRPSAVTPCATRFGATGQACALSVIRLKRRLSRAINWFPRSGRADRPMPSSARWHRAPDSATASASKGQCNHGAAEIWGEVRDWLEANGVEMPEGIRLEPPPEGGAQRDQ